MNKIHVAYHEAGHAVACIAQKIPVELVSITPGEGSSYLGINITPSLAASNCGGVRNYQKLERAQMLVCYAGWAAELERDPNTEPNGHNKDFADAFRWSVEHGVLPRYMNLPGDEQHLAYLEKLKKESRKLIKKHWLAVEALAKKLYRRKKLGPEAVYRIPEIDRLMQEVCHPWRRKEGVRNE